MCIFFKRNKNKNNNTNNNNVMMNANSQFCYIADTHVL
jgi:hypothetical protein